MGGTTPISAAGTPRSARIAAQALTHRPRASARPRHLAHARQAPASTRRAGWTFGCVSPLTMQILTVPELLNLSVPLPSPFGDRAVLHVSQGFLASTGIGSDGGPLRKGRRSASRMARPRTCRRVSSRALRVGLRPDIPPAKPLSRGHRAQARRLPPGLEAAVMTPPMDRTGGPPTGAPPTTILPPTLGRGPLHRPRGVGGPSPVCVKTDA